MKKVFVYVVMVLLIFVPLNCVYATNININGENVTFNNETGYPFLDGNDRTQVPLRVTMEKAGATVTWDAVTKTATVEKRGIVVKVPVGANYIIVNGQQVTNDTASMIIDGRTYLPIRAVLEAIEFGVTWDKASQTVIAANFYDQVLNEGNIVEEQRKNIKDINDLLEYYRSKLQHDQNWNLATKMAEKNAIDNLTKDTIIIPDWCADDDLKRLNVTVDTSGLTVEKHHSTTNKDYTDDYTYDGQIVLNGNGKSYTIDIDQLTLYNNDDRDERNIRTCGEIRIKFLVNHGITGFSSSFDYQFSGEDLLSLGLV